MAARLGPKGVVWLWKERQAREDPSGNTTKDSKCSWLATAPSTGRSSPGLGWAVWGGPTEGSLLPAGSIPWAASP